MASEFPLPSVNAAYPIPLFFELQPEVFSVSRTIYDDQGADYKLQAGGTGVKRWIIRYDGLSLADAAIIDAHVATTYYSEEEGSAVGFNFRHHVAGTAWTATSGTLYSAVHYAPNGYKVGHSKVGSQSREIILEKRP
jgi:hypothetical protein